MPDQTPFEVDPYAPTEEHIKDADNLLREIPPEDTRSPAEQLIENARIHISTTEASITSSCKF